MKRPGWGLIVAVVLSAVSAVGCGQKVDGIYQGYSTMLLVQIAWKMDIQGDKATIAAFSERLTTGKTQKLSEFDMKLARDEERIVGTDNQGKQVTFHVKNGGKTLECRQCESFRLPVVWEKKIN